jgi:hypothetical protein
MYAPNASADDSMNEQDHILSYSPPAPRRSPVPVFGVVLCVIGACSGLLIAAFGVWWFVMSGLNGAGRGIAIVFTGALLIYLCARWYGKARRAMSAE